MILALTLKNAKANGTDIEIKMIMDIANLVLKLKLKNRKTLRKIPILIYCSIVEELAN